MRLSRFICTASLAVVAMGLLAARKYDSFQEREVARIRAHFDSVLTELQARPIQDLTSDAASRRAALVAELHAYRDRGAFPHNYDFPGQSVPYFVDRGTGVACAVANLLIKTGRSDIVDRVRRSNNNVYVAELRGDTTFAQWLATNGLSLEEAARIQVPYNSGPSPAVIGGAVVLGVASLTAITGSVVTGVWNATSNADGHRTRVSKLGVGMGVVSALVGGALLESRGADKRASAAVLGVGAGSVALSLRSMNRHSSIMAQKEAASRPLAEARIEPTVDSRGGVGARAGLSIGF